uniref:Uncharacterized protein n=1 Tax=Arundo donax TaxID=35708 RepID=A0A0A9EHW3_ARUDO
MAPVSPGRRNRDSDMSAVSPATADGIWPCTSPAPSMKTLFTRPASSHRTWSHLQQSGDAGDHVDSVAGLPSDCFTLSSARRSLGGHRGGGCGEDRAGAAAAATSNTTRRNEVVDAAIVASLTSSCGLELA